jgi:hypothetical protein
MFERYTEPARRVIFFARYEASQYGSTTIETPHFLLGLIREDKFLLRRFLPNSAGVMGIREHINRLVEIRDKTSTSIDLPLSDECKRILAHSAKEAEQLKHDYIGTIHLLLGIFGEKNCTAARVLSELGLELESAREEALRNPSTSEPFLPGTLGHSLNDPQIPQTALPAAGVVPDADTAIRIAQAVWRPRLQAPAEDAKALSAVMIHGVWLVTGSHTVNGSVTALAAFIQKEDGRILRIHQESPAS